MHLPLMRISVNCHIWTILPVWKVTGHHIHRPQQLQNADILENNNKSTHIQAIIAIKICQLFVDWIAHLWPAELNSHLGEVDH